MTASGKGLTTVTATVFLLAIGVSSSGAVLVFQQQIEDDLREGSDQIETMDLKETLRVEQCYQKNGFTQIVVRNQGSEAIDPSNINIYKNNTPLNVKIGRDVVDPTRSFEINTTTDLEYEEDKLRFTSNSSTATHICQNNSVETIPVSPNGPYVSLSLNHGSDINDKTVKADLYSSQGASPIDTCNIDWGDGNTESVPQDGTVTHTYGSNGTYSSQYSCTDNNGLKDLSTDTIKVSTSTCGSNSPPSTDFSITTSGFQVDVTSSTTDPDGNTVKYRWDWTSDGTYDSTGSTQSHIYGSSGIYTIKHYSEDSCGASDSLTKTVIVQTPLVGEIIEKGGSGNAEIGTLTVPGTAEIRGPDSPTGSNICLGVDCPDTSGSETSLDTDQYVNESGDRMDGTLYTDGFSSGGDICIGTDCLPVSDTAGPGLSPGNQDTQSDFRLEVPAVRPNTGNNLCLGTDC